MSGPMTIAPLPVRGGFHIDRRGDGRALRVSAHPELGLVTISLWRGDRCVGTHQVSLDEMPEVVRLMTSALVPPTASGAAAG